MNATRNAYTPLQGFYGSTMYHWVVDDFGNALVTVWPLLELIED